MEAYVSQSIQRTEYLPTAGRTGYY